MRWSSTHATSPWPGSGGTISTAMDCVVIKLKSEMCSVSVHGRNFGNRQIIPERSARQFEQVERIKGFMRQRGLSEEVIEERLKRMRERRGGGGP